MRRIYTFLLILFCLNANLFAIDVIPYPQKVVQTGGVSTLSHCSIYYDSDESKHEADKLLSYLRDEKISVAYTKAKDKANVLFCLDENFESSKKNCYQLKSRRNKIEIKGNSATALFYGIQTLRQLIERDHKDLRCSNLTIVDYPTFQWRSFLLDESRAFKGKEIVKGLLDDMALLKMNVFHWHLTDDQGWRVEIKKYPKLTEVGARRDSTQIGGYAGTSFDGTEHSGFYTQEEIKDIVQYAKDRHIEILPEFEMPGHQSAAIASYPMLGTIKDQISVPCHFGVQKNVFDVSSPLVYRFIEDVFDELISLFPFEVLHIGGDEVKYDQWKSSEEIQKYMQQNKLKSPSELQIFFINKVSKILEGKGKSMMGWNDITGDIIHEYHSSVDLENKGHLAENTIVQFWKGDIKLISETAKKGYRIVNSHHWETYLDYTYERIPLEKAYNFNPIPVGLDENLYSQILGMGCQMWGEEIMDNKAMYNQIFPRIGAYAEAAWTAVENKDYSRFCKSILKMEQGWKAKYQYE